MRLFAYYALHSLKNQIRKLFKTWVAIFIAACFLFGILIGSLLSLIPDPEESTDDPDGFGEEEVIDRPDLGNLTDEERAIALQTVEAVAGLVVIVVIFANVFSADKSGSAIFQPADVNLLFTAPLTPQSVLLFRLTSQFGLILFASFYLLFQMPGISKNLNLGGAVIPAIYIAWLFVLIFGKLIQMLVYLIASAHPRARSRIRPLLFTFTFLLGGAFFALYRLGKNSAFDSAVKLFNFPGSRFIPVFGWLKGFIISVIEGDFLLTVIFSCLSLLGIMLLVYIIWHIKADFYEEALSKTSELAELRQNVSEGRTIAAIRKKDRAERIRRDILTRGSGANVFFWKSIQNRFRFGHLRYFTKTSETYLVLGVGAALAVRFIVGSRVFVPVPLAIAAFAFFRSLGNPLSQDIHMDFFIMIPESVRSKIFWSLLGGGANCALDILPGMLAATVILGANPLSALAWCLFIVSVDFYSTNTGVFIDLSIPVFAGKTIKQMIQMLFVYFGLIPDAAALIIGAAAGSIAAGALAAALINALLGLVFLSLSPSFLQNGRK